MTERCCPSIAILSVASARSPSFTQTARLWTSGTSYLGFELSYVVPKRITTDKLRSYHVAIRNLGLTAEHNDDKSANNRAENSHQPVRRRERKQQRFKSPGSAQRFLNIYSSVCNAVYVQRHLLNRSTLKRFRTDVFNVWDCASAAA